MDIQAFALQQPGGPNSVNYDGRYFVIMGGIVGGLLGAAAGDGITKTDVFHVAPVEGLGTTRRESTK